MASSFFRANCTRGIRIGKVVKRMHRNNVVTIGPGGGLETSIGYEGQTGNAALLRSYGLGCFSPAYQGTKYMMCNLKCWDLKSVMMLTNLFEAVVAHGFFSWETFISVGKHNFVGPILFTEEFGNIRNITWFHARIYDYMGFNGMITSTEKNGIK